MSEQTDCCVCGGKTINWLLTNDYRAVCKERGCYRTPAGKRLLATPPPKPKEAH